MLEIINEKLVELGKRRDGVWQRQVTELLNMIEECLAKSRIEGALDVLESSQFADMLDSEGYGVAREEEVAELKARLKN